VHDLMPLILARENYERWLALLKSDPADLLRPYDSAAMRAYPRALGGFLGREASDCSGQSAAF